MIFDFSTTPQGHQFDPRVKSVLASFGLNIFYVQEITSNTVQYIQFIRKLGIERKRKLIEFFSYLHSFLLHMPTNLICHMTMFVKNKYFTPGPPSTTLGND